MIGLHVGMAGSTVHRVLVRHGLNRLKWLDRPTGKPIRRYEREHSGELIHLDIKKVGKIPSGGGWKVNGRSGSKRTKVGYTYLHCAVDDHSRVAYVEPHDDESGESLVGFWKRAREWFHGKGMIIDEVMSDNGGNFRYGKFADELKITGTKHIRIKPFCPQTNGKVERFNRTLADELLYARVFRSEAERRRRLTHWVHMYNLHRNHTAIGGPPASSVNNVCGHYNWAYHQLSGSQLSYLPKLNRGRPLRLERYSLPLAQRCQRSNSIENDNGPPQRSLRRLPLHVFVDC